MAKQTPVNEIDQGDCKKCILNFLKCGLCRWIKFAVAATCSLFRFGMCHMTFSHSIINSRKRKNCLLYQKHSNVKVLYLQLSELRVNYKATIIHSTEHYPSNVNQYISCLTDERDLLVPVCLVIKEHIFLS